MYIMFELDIKCVVGFSLRRKQYEMPTVCACKVREQRHSSVTCLELTGVIITDCKGVSCLPVDTVRNTHYIVCYKKSCGCYVTL